MINDSLSVIRERLEMQDAPQEDLTSFLMFKILGATIVKTLNSASQNYPLQVSIAEYFSSYPTGKSSNSGTNQYLFGHLRMKVKYPNSYIHKETIREKFTDLFLKHDVDFEHSKMFSGRFQVVTEDKQQLQHLLQFKNLDALTAHPEMELEFNNEACLFRCSRKSISIEETNNFCELAKTLLTMFN
ncbi:hypothetical protein A4H97_10760 [Niastella yeongjuensis]|uniref:Uncharacterized protein n=1 Tax=Niastella yeongjuensis TaxID=354355 RepID=A0A1V9EFD7_9BACT|nr:hypothetical protein [Niastella yeongjuensis]OQP44833.1 hypothetical protein A4H97_10760 [Niastella yeongjuensis]SEP42091.1 hypothetical protein SAMN05660816_05946 [Niastella yeongjuensis]